MNLVKSVQTYDSAEPYGPVTVTFELDKWELFKMLRDHSLSEEVILDVIQVEIKAVMRALMQNEREKM